MMGSRRRLPLDIKLNPLEVGALATIVYINTEHHQGLEHAELGPSHHARTEALRVHFSNASEQLCNVVAPADRLLGICDARVYSPIRRSYHAPLDTDDPPWSKLARPNSRLHQGQHW